MSLLSDLESIDLSDVIEARGSISASINTPGMQRILSGGAAEIALAGLGSSLQSLTGKISGPEELLRPLLDALSEITGRFGNLDLPIDRYLAVLDDAEDVLKRLVRMFGNDAGDIGRLFGVSLKDALKAAEQLGNGAADRIEQYLPQFTQLLNVAESGLSLEPKVLANFAIDALLPFPKEPVIRLRGSIDGLLSGVGGIQLPSARTDGLRIALNNVLVRARTGTEVEVTAALRDLERVRVNTSQQLRADLRQTLNLVTKLRVPDLAGDLARAIPDLRGLGDGILDFLANMRSIIAQARANVAQVDFTQVTGMMTGALDAIEATARPLILNAIEETLRQLEAFVRNLLNQLGIRRLRYKLTAAIHDVAQEIQDARLDRFAVQARALLDELTTTLASAGGLPAAIQDSLRDVEREINEAADVVLDALDRISAAIQAVAANARAPLQAAVKAISEFQGAIDAATQALNSLGIEKSADQVVATLQSLREKAETVLAVTPLPEPLRPTVEQLIELVENIDIDSVLEPAREAAAELQIPEDVGDNIRKVLEQVAEKLDNLIPAQLIADINAEVESVIAKLESFDPASLLPDVRGFLEQAAAQVRALRIPPDAVDTVRAPFVTLLEAIDAVHPDKLLAPVVSAYDSLMGRVKLPDPANILTSASDLLDNAGNSMSDRLTKSVGDFGTNKAPGAAPAAPQRATPTTSGVPAVAPRTDPFGAGVRPGDLIRFFGFLPAKLREAMMALENTAALQTLKEIDRHTSGLARDIRAIPDVVWAIERGVEQWINELTNPLRQLQLQTLLALHARVQAGDFSASFKFDAVVNCSVGAIRDDLAGAVADVRQTIQQVLEGPGSPGKALEGVALLLERASITKLTGDLDAFLAALDPEPMAHELDELMAAIIARAPDLLEQVGADLRAVYDRFRALIDELNPAAHLERFVRILEILKEEIDVLNPRRLATELGEVHAAIRAAVAAYDPAILAQEIGEVIEGAATGILALDPATLLGDVSFLSEPVNRIRQANPATALATVGTELDEVGEQLKALNPKELITSVNALGPRALEEMEEGLEGIQAEIVALLKALRFAIAQASVSVEAEVRVA